MFETSSQDKMYKEILATNIDQELLDWTKTKTLEFQKMLTYYRCAIKEVETKFRVLDEEHSLQNDRNPISVIKVRLKSVPSIMEKLQRKGYPFSLQSIEENIHDVAGIRVVCSFERDVYTLAKALLNQDDIVLISKKDYIKNPKPNGYRSLHLIVQIPIFLETEKKQMKVEIQLRTIAMDCWASLEHQLRYKKGKQFTDEMSEALLRCSQLSTDMDKEMDRLREESGI